MRPITDSKKINSFPVNHECNLILTVTSSVPKENVGKFFLNCESSEMYSVVCFARLNLANPDLRKLKRSDVIELKNVICRQWQKRNQYIDYDFEIEFNSEVYILLPNNGQPRQVFPKNGRDEPNYLQSAFPMKEIKSMSSLNIEKPRFSPSNLQEIKRCRVNDFCNIVLKVDSYELNHDHKQVYVRCLANDETPVLIAAPLHCHSEEVKTDDIIQFINVQRLDSGPRGIQFKFDKGSQALLTYRNGSNRIPPPKLLTGQIKERHRSENGRSIGYDIAGNSTNGMKKSQELPKVTNAVQNGSIEEKKVTGILTTDFGRIKHGQTKKLMYEANLLLDDKSDAKLLIDSEFANWPFYLLKKGHRVFFTGKRDKDAWIVGKNNVLDFDDLLQK